MDSDSDSLSDEFDEIDEQNNREISQFALEVVDFSSQYGSDPSISYAAVNVCGRPSKYPLYGDFAETYALKNYGPSTNEREFVAKDSPYIPFHDFIIIKYENYVLPTAIKIFETFNPGAVVRIYAFCSTIRKWEVLWQATPSPVEKKSREFSPPIRRINFPVKIIRLDFNHSLLDYYTGIDGILLIGLKCRVPNEFESKPSEQAVIKGIIQKKLETVQFRPAARSEAIEDFLKNDLNRFIENVGLNSNLSDNERNMPPTIVELTSNNKQEKKISDVPYEVLFNIMSFLDLKTIYQCSKVCRSFRHITLDPLLYVEINLKFYWSFANSNLLESLTHRASLVKKLDLSSCGYFGFIQSLDFINFIRANGKTLTNLRLNSCPFLNTSCLEIISITCLNLIELSLRNYINIQEHDFVSLTLLNKLERLDLSRAGVDKITLLNILKNNPNLKHLNLAFSSQQVTMDDICIHISNYNIKMVSIDMWKCHALSSVGVRALAQCTQLEELDFGWCLREEPSISESLKLLIQNCNNLRKLVLAAIRGISERDLENIANYCANLEHLDLMGIMSVSTEMCLKILHQCPKLKILDLSFCTVDDLSIMRWRSDFNVSIKRSEVPSE